MNPHSYQEAIAEILEQDDRFHADAYEFVRAGLDFTIKEMDKPTEGPGRHISGGELMEGIRRFALQEYGPMTLQVLNHWGVRKSEDVGSIVFNLVETNILGKTEEDTIEDFTDVYDFADAFQKPFLPDPA